MTEKTWTCEALDSGYMITKVWSLPPDRREAEEEAVGVVRNLIAWLGITKYKLVREEESE